MIDAARYLHNFSPALVRRDIKPANFVVNIKGNAKLTGFGESRSLPLGKTNTQHLATIHFEYLS
uniref:Protein kinase domain-containing protein n=1 Tax=Globisporangium ultimum (strain ATCC 200006 / CBS 805.95 / DAOM BR144) TaxID=431595 RepID=K3X293_GLOUD